MRYLIDNTLKTNDRLRFSVDRAGSLNETVKSFCAFLLNKGKLVSIQVFSEVTRSNMVRMYLSIYQNGFGYGRLFLIFFI